jgi:hypothetical protein
MARIWTAMVFYHAGKTAFEDHEAMIDAELPEGAARIRDALSLLAQAYPSAAPQDSYPMNRAELNTASDAGFPRRHALEACSTLRTVRQPPPHSCAAGFFIEPGASALHAPPRQAAGNRAVRTRGEIMQAQASLQAWRAAGAFFQLSRSRHLLSHRR